MQSSATRRTVAVRTEVEVAADAVMALFDSGIIGNSAHTLARVAEITCIPVSELRAAWERIKRRGYRAPSTRAATPTAPPPPAAPLPSLVRANERRWVKKNPAPGQRICSKCHETKPVAEFDIKNQRTGEMKSWCRPCFRGYQRERYVKASEAGMVTAIRMLLQAGSPFIGDACRSCGHPLNAGEEVEACDVVVRHVCCPTTPRRN